MSGFFITFEGGEGTGKSTQIAALAESLRGEGCDVVTTREPGGSPRAEEIRNFLLAGKAKPHGAFAESLLFAAARIDHLRVLIEPALKRGAIVLCDRFADSTRVYQGAASGLDAGLIRALERATLAGRYPDLTLILDCPVEKSLLRARARAGESEQDRFETEEQAFHQRIRDGFLALAAEEPGRCVVIDADRPAAAIAKSVLEIVHLRLASTGGAAMKELS
jgi:dTMP kinase